MNPITPKSAATRRVFLLTLAVAGPVMAQTKPAAPAAPAGLPLVNEKDPQAVALGYLADASKVDTKKYPKFTKDQACAGCQLFQGKAGEASGGCAIFPGKAVAAKGWCASWVKKA